jgi:hypothetical protein
VLCFAASIGMICVAFGLVYLHVLSAQKQFQINRLTTIEQAAQARYQQQRVAVETENSPGRIMAAAQRLGMVAPSGVTVLKASGAPAVGMAAPTTGPRTTAPGGIANWSKDKSDLSGNP